MNNPNPKQALKRIRRLTVSTLGDRYVVYILLDPPAASINPEVFQLVRACLPRTGTDLVVPSFVLAAIVDHVMIGDFLVVYTPGM